MNVQPGIVKTKTRVIGRNYFLNAIIAKSVNQIRYETCPERITGVAKRVTLECPNSSFDQTGEISSPSHLRPQCSDAGILRTPTTCKPRLESHRVTFSKPGRWNSAAQNSWQSTKNPAQGFLSLIAGCEVCHVRELMGYECQHGVFPLSADVRWARKSGIDRNELNGVVNR